MKTIPTDALLSVQVDANIGEGTDNDFMTQADVDRLGKALGALLEAEGWVGKVSVNIA